jgi:SAM-dependent methyltransferase
MPPSKPIVFTAVSPRSVAGDVTRADLGAVMLEVGPGPGAATGWLSRRVTSLVAVEADAEAARALARAHAGTNVEVLARDAGTLPFDDGHSDSAGASDSLPSDGLHRFHEDDTYNPVEPGTLFTRLDTIGHADITIRVAQGLTFIAHKPGPQPS